MSDTEDEVSLFNSYIKTCMFFNERCEDHSIDIVKTKLDNYYSYFILKNSSDICQKVYIEYEYNEDINDIIELNEIKIVDVQNCYLDTPFNIDEDTSYILFKDIENYLYWFSTIDENFRLDFLTPRQTPQ
jgi:hypothetical protein